LDHIKDKLEGHTNEMVGRVFETPQLIISIIIIIIASVQRNK